MICKCYRIKAGIRGQNHLRSILAGNQMAQRDGRHHPLLGHLFITTPPTTDPATKRSWDLKLTRNHRCCKSFFEAETRGLQQMADKKRWRNEPLDFPWWEIFSLVVGASHRWKGGAGARATGTGVSSLILLRDRFKEDVTLVQKIDF